MKDREALAQLDAFVFDVQRRANELGVEVKLWNVGLTRDFRDPYFRVSPEEMDRLLRTIATALRVEGQRMVNDGNFRTGQEN